MICHRLNSGHYGPTHLRRGIIMTMMKMTMMIMVITIVMMMVMLMFLTSLMYRGGRRNPYTPPGSSKRETHLRGRKVLGW